MIMNKERFNLLFALISCLCIGTGITVLPLFENKSGLETFQESVTATVDETVSVSDPPNNTSPAYHYWTAPPNSFGIQETRTVNWTYFKALFQKHFYKKALYKRYSWSDWTDGTQYLTLNKTWNESGFWKVDIILDVPVDLYSVNVSFGCDLQVLNYVERDGYEILLNYTANATETYQIKFNWSDIASIPNLEISKHRTDGKFWISFKRDNVPSGYYVFDPTFGVETLHTALNSGIANDIAGTKSSGPANDGTADNITFGITDGQWTSGEKVKCALYTLDTGNVYDFVAETDERDSGGDGWQVFTFSSPPAIYSAETYGIVIVMDSYIQIRGTTVGGDNRLWTTGVDVYAFGDPHTFSGTYSGEYSAYCSYTESGAGWSNTCPVSSSESLSNKSTGVSVDVGYWNVSVTDIDANNTWGNITCSNGNHAEWNNSANGTKSMVLATLWYSTNYTVWLNFTDVLGVCSINETYWFVTEARTWQNLSYGYLTGGNVTSFTNTSYGYLTGGNTTGYSNVSYGYLTGGNATSHTNISYGYLTGGNVTGHVNISYGYLTGGNATGYGNVSYGYLTGGNVTAFQNLSYGYLTGGNITTNLPPQFSNEDPTDGHVIYVTSYNWSLNISDMTMFNWTIECSDGQNSSGTNDTNGTFYLNLSGLVTYTTYTVWINASDGYSSANDSYIFTVMPPAVSSGGGGKVPAEEEDVVVEPQEPTDQEWMAYSGFLAVVIFLLFLYKRREKKREGKK